MSIVYDFDAIAREMRRLRGEPKLEIVDAEVIEEARSASSGAYYAGGMGGLGPAGAFQCTRCGARDFDEIAEMCAGCGIEA